MKHFKFNRKRKKNKENITFLKENNWRSPDLKNISEILKIERKKELNQLRKRVK